MYNSNMSSPYDLPSTSKLVISTIGAVFTALIILITVVMPAEYGIDPTGVGKLTGLQRMGEIKMNLAQEAAAERLAKEQSLAVKSQPTVKAPAPQIAAVVTAPPVASSTPATPSVPTPQIRKDTTTITLQPNEGNEVKVDLKKGEVVNFSWVSDAGKANFDIHGDSKKLAIDYHGYGKGSSTREKGSIEAAFDGSHGWFWRNRSGALLTITLQTEGPYTSVKRVK